MRELEYIGVWSLGQGCQTSSPSSAPLPPAPDHGAPCGPDIDLVAAGTTAVREVVAAAGSVTQVAVG